METSLQEITSSQDKLRTDLISSTQTLIAESGTETLRRIKELEKSLATLKDNIKQDLDAKLYA
jgi:Mg2+ and Co2+ transporter CorA